MSEKRTEITSAMKDAMREKDELALTTIRLINAAIKDKDIAARPTGNVGGISDADILSLLQSMIKQRQESSKAFRDGGREDLATKEDAEIKVIERFLPAQLSDSEVENVVAAIISGVGAASIKDMGKVMAELKANYAGQIDMGKAGVIIKQKLGG